MIIFPNTDSKSKTGIKKKAALAMKYFRNGMFSEAEHLFKEVLNKIPDNKKSIIYAGYCAQLNNRLDEAESYLKQGLEMDKDNKSIQNLLSAVYYRKGDFPKAAQFYRATGQIAAAKKLESFGFEEIYQIEAENDVIFAPFVKTDPIPLIHVRINGGKKSVFFIDTGGGEVILDSTFAKEVTAETFGSENGEFGGGNISEYSHGKIKSLEIGGMQVKNLPINMINLRDILKSVPGLENITIDGAIGTVFLNRFISTIDYISGKLILWMKTEKNYKILEESLNNRKNDRIPFYLAMERYIIARGTVNKNTSGLFFVDTGLAGQAFTSPKSILKKSGIHLDKKKSMKGMGAGGTFVFIPFDIDTLSLGDFERKGLHGNFGAFPFQIEKAFGFPIIGLISHEFFRNSALTLDIKNMKLIIERQE